MNIEVKQSSDNAVSSTFSYNSMFFGNYLDNSQMDNTQSDAQPSSIEVLDTSSKVMEMKVKNIKQLLSVQRLIVLRSFVNRWYQKKECIKRQQMKTPAAMTKALLKMCMLLNVKIKTKIHFFFVRCKKVAKDRQPIQKSQINAVLPNGSVQPNVSAQLSVQVPVQIIFKPMKRQMKPQEKKSNFIIYVMQGLTKLQIVVQKLKLKYSDFSFMKAAFNQILKKNITAVKFKKIAKILQLKQQNFMQFAWQQFNNWLNFKDKLQIFVETVNMLVNQQMRTAILMLRINSASSQAEISRILQNEVKCAVPLSMSTENIFSQLHMIPNNGESKEQSMDQMASPFDLMNQVNSKQSNFCSNKEEEQLFSKNHPKNLKFSRDIKRKSNNVHSYVPTEEAPKSKTPQSEKLNSLQAQCLRSELNQSSNFLSRREVFNNSFANTSAVFKKSSIGFQPHLLKTNSASCKLKDQQFQILMNSEQAVNFCNISHSFRSRPNKNDDFHPEITDFNDQFFIRDVMNYYFAVASENQLQSDKNIIADSKNVTYVNDQYCAFEQPSRVKKSFKTSHHINHLPLTPPFRKTIAKSSSKINIQQYQYNAISKNVANNLKIPRSPPKFFDYYVEKPHWSNHFAEGKGSAKSLSCNRSSNSFVSKISTGPTLALKPQKNLFKTVKSGTKISLKPPQSYIPRSTQTNLDRKHSKSKTLNQAVIKQLTKKQERGPSQEYLIEFGDPPKKKVKRANL